MNVVIIGSVLLKYQGTARMITAQTSTSHIRKELRHIKCAACRAFALVISSMLWRHKSSCRDMCRKALR